MDEFDELLSRQDEHIDRIGWSVTVVLPTDDDPGAPFAYTVGLTEHFTDLPLCDQIVRARTSRAACCSLYRSRWLSPPRAGRGRGGPRAVTTTAAAPSVTATTSSRSSRQEQIEQPSGCGGTRPSRQFRLTDRRAVGMVGGAPSRLT